MRPDPDAFAALLCDWCLEAREGDQVLVGTTVPSMPLALAVHGALLQRGAWPLLRLAADTLAESFYRHATDAHLGGFAPLELAEAQLADAFLTIAGYAHTHGLGLAIATLAVTGAAAGNVVARAAAGAASDRFGVDSVLVAVLASNLLAATIFAAGSDSALAVVFGSVAAGAGFGGTAGLNSRAGSLSAPDAPNTSFGVHFAGFSVGALAGPLLGSALGGGTFSWLAVGAPSLMGLAVVALRAATTRAAGPAPG